MHAVARVALEVGVGEQCSPFAVGEIPFQFFEIRLRHRLLSHPVVEQEQVVVGIVHARVFGVVVGEPSQFLLAEGQVVELVLEDNPGVVQSVHYNLVALRHLLLGERDLRHVVFPLVRVVLRAVGKMLYGVLHGSGVGERVAHLVGHLLHAGSLRHHCLVHALPVVHVLALAPQFLELRLSLAYRHRVVEIPSGVLLVRR